MKWALSGYSPGSAHKGPGTAGTSETSRAERCRPHCGPFPTLQEHRDRDVLFVRLLSIRLTLTACRQSRHTDSSNIDLLRLLLPVVEQRETHHHFCIIMSQKLPLIFHPLSLSPSIHARFKPNNFNHRLEEPKLAGNRETFLIKAH